MSDFRIPYHYPDFNPGLQIVNLQQGGPSSHPREQVTQPRIWPLFYRVALMGLGNMPRQVFNPLPFINNNSYSNPSSASNLQIAGLMKKP
jgi:hypothetical protein